MNSNIVIKLGVALLLGSSLYGTQSIKVNYYELVKKLDKYSEKGAEYGKELTSMIKYNRFYKFD